MERLGRRKGLVRIYLFQLDSTCLPREQRLSYAHKPCVLISLRVCFICTCACAICTCLAPLHFTTGAMGRVRHACLPS